MSLPDYATLIPAAHQPLIVDVRGRRCERRLGVLALLAVAACGPLLPVSSHLAAVFVIFACALLAAGLWWHGWLGGARRVTQIRRNADGRWLLSDGRQENIPAHLSADSRVGSQWLWLRWRTDGLAGGPRSRSMLILQGDVAGNELRRLGVRLRLESVYRQPGRAEARCAGV
ncbi:hypothetical protein JM946_10165 [Steroidobacter sp. S1-65]|uniref:Toxin CptA n=1 Tax=Steroidobacter gossypii TaxID=2805490 RepID=A0ABS1WVW4_9GAMM|nr:hypothetical protein [Steroidobacter gossypii]MBM0105117.1 hypothetical protein [Steroidobacter gossypii]